MIDFIIPAKTESKRVPNKNWRPFHNRKSLVAITIEKLIHSGVEPCKIHLSCESELVAGPVASEYGVNLIVRDDGLCDNKVPLTRWIRSITAQVPGRSDIAWCQVCDPLFNEYAECLQMWRHRADHDSLVVCYPWRGYLMTDIKSPIGWGFGEHHTPSQRLPKFLTMPFTLSILTRESIEATGYHVGQNPLWYEAKGDHIDIDTEFDFRVASVIYGMRQQKSSTAAAVENAYFLG